MTQKSKQGPVKTEKDVSLADVRKYVPKEAFNKSFWTALTYVIRDYACWGGTLALMHFITNTQQWDNAPFIVKGFIYCIFSASMGAFMWSLFLLGHDYGHGLMTESTLVNDIFGHLVHSTIFIPFYPWQLSHRRHHMNHNHETKDYASPVFTPEVLAGPDILPKLLDKFKVLRLFYPVIGWPMYLVVGLPDGTHFLPLPFQRLWQDTPVIEYWKCIFSTSVVVVFFYLQCVVHGGTWRTSVFYLLGPHIGYSWWANCVNYLNHHDGKNTLVFQDHDWSFVPAAFQTCDRTFGWGFDWLFHHVTDGHVAHHLFFTTVPHYNLPLATAGLHKYLADNDLTHIYQYKVTYDFPLEFYRHMWNYGFLCQRASTVKAEKEAAAAAAATAESKKGK